MLMEMKIEGNMKKEERVEDDGMRRLRTSEGAGDVRDLGV